MAEDIIRHPIMAVEGVLPSASGTKQGLRMVYNTSLFGIQVAFALIMALAWYSLVKGVMQTVLPGGTTMTAKLIYAVVMTIIFIIISYIISNKLGVSVLGQIGYSSGH